MAYDKVCKVDGTDDYRQPIEASIDANPSALAQKLVQIAKSNESGMAAFLIDREIDVTPSLSEARTVIQEFLALMDDGVLVRDTKDDADFLAFAKQGIRIGNAIARAKTALQSVPVTKEK